MHYDQFPIGIIGGAGPTAGGYLFQKIIHICQEKYNCQKDADFPYLILLSYPFVDMLGENVNRQQVSEQLDRCVQNLIANKVAIAAIACNTLHGFLSSRMDNLQLVHFIEETKQYLHKKGWNNPLILCSSTAAQSKLHSSYFSCRYPDNVTQDKIDALINEVTAGCCLKVASSQLSSLIDEESAVVLGCTELSVIHETVPLDHLQVCNPNQIVAEKICELTFSRSRNKQ